MAAKRTRPSALPLSQTDIQLESQELAASKSSGAKKTKRAATCPKTVSYVRGFHPPTRSEAAKAIGDDAHSGFYFPDEKVFPSIPQPTSIDDWLAQYVEEGQTFEEFCNQTPWLSPRKIRGLTQPFVSTGSTIQEKYPNGKIYIVALGDFSEDAPDITKLSEYVSKFYCLPTSILPRLKLNCDESNVFVEGPSGKETALSNRYDAASGHRQLAVSGTLAFLRSMIPADALCLIALTMQDLYDTKPDLFVAGMAAGSHRVGVFSFYRYDPARSFSSEFWYKCKASPSITPTRKKLIFSRSCKLLVHEIAHLLGVDHCIWYSCCMNGSGHLQEDFAQPMFLCPVDLRKLQVLCGFDLLERYKGMLEFFTKNQLEEEVSWISDRIATVSARAK